MNYNPIDSCYKKAIQDYGVIAKLGEIETKVLIRETSDAYGIDYKKIISATKVSQGNYVVMNGVQYLIIDVEEQLSQSVYDIGVFRKALPLLVGSTYKPIMGIVDRNKVNIVSTQGIQAEYDQYNFIIPKLGNSKVSVNTEIVWDGGIYTTISVDTTKDGLLVVTGKYKDVYNPHIYTITLNSNSQTLKETENYTIIPSCTDNGQVVTSPVVTYISSATNIATISATGVVSCVGVGSTTIICTYNGVSSILQLVVEAKPITPVVSYTDNWSQPINTTGLKQYVTAVYTVTRSTNAVVENPYVDYVFDSAGQSLILNKKIIVTRISDNSFSVKNALITSTMTCHVTITDHADGHIIKDNQLLTFIKGI